MSVTPRLLLVLAALVVGGALFVSCVEEDATVFDEQAARQELEQAHQKWALNAKALRAGQDAKDEEYRKRMAENRERRKREYEEEISARVDMANGDSGAAERATAVNRRREESKIRQNEENEALKAHAQESAAEWEELNRERHAEIQRLSLKLQKAREATVERNKRERESKRGKKQSPQV